MTTKKTVSAVGNISHRPTREEQKDKRTGSASKRVDEEPANETANETNNGGKRDRSGGLAKRHAADEYYGFHTCTMPSEISV